MAENKPEGIPVIIRIKPIAKEQESIITVDDINIKIKNTTGRKKENKFRFNFVYDEDTETKEIYEKHCFKILDNIVKGYNGTIMSYGMTGSGKTYTMSDDPKGGIIQNIFHDLFDLVNTSQLNMLIQLSYFQIYLDSIIDLLPKKLSIRGTKDKHFIDGLSVYTCTSVEGCLELFEKGKKARITAETKSNMKSSRSHAILKLTVISREDEKSIHEGNLYLVDLAGSERVNKSQATGLRKDEASKINLSMLALTRVITALAKKEKHIPYNNTQLTRVLKNSLGGNSKTVFIANISPAADFFNETSDALKYAQSVTLIKNQPKINEESSDSVVNVLKLENKTLKEEIENLQKQIDELKNQKQNEKQDEESDYDSDNENHKKLSEEERKKRRMMAELKSKMNDLSQNEEFFNKLDELIKGPPFNSKDIDPSMLEKIERKRAQANQEFIELLITENKYTDEELEIFKFENSADNDKEALIKIEKLISTIRSLKNENENLQKENEALRYENDECSDLYNKLIKDIGSNNSEDETEGTTNNDDEISSNVKNDRSDDNGMFSVSRRNYSRKREEEKQKMIQRLTKQVELLNEKIGSLKNDDENETDAIQVEIKPKDTIDDFLKKITNEEEYTSEELKLLNLDANEFDKINKNTFESVLNLIKKQNVVIKYYKAEIDNIMGISTKYSGVLEQFKKERQEKQPVTVHEAFIQSGICVLS